MADDGARGTAPTATEMAVALEASLGIMNVAHFMKDNTLVMLSSEEDILEALALLHDSSDDCKCMSCCWILPQWHML